jgi:hypothetical protein
MVLTAGLWGCGGADRGGDPRPPVISEPLAAKSKIPDPVAQSCAECHKEAYEDWLHSQHARAMRLIGGTVDDEAFVPSRQLRYPAL